MSYLEMSTEQIHDLIERGGLDDDMFFSLHEEAKEFEKEAIDSDICWNAVLDYVLNKGYMESPMEFLRCWNEGNFEALREEWPDAPEEIYLADPLYKGEK
jgi:hypothetical protein